MDSIDKILDLLNETNVPTKPLTKKNVGLYDVTSVEVDGPITRITVAALPGRGYHGSVVVEYQRLDLGQIVNGVTVRSLDPLTPLGVVNLINSALGLFLTPSDLVPFATPTPEEGTATVLTIEALPDAPGFIGYAQINVEFGRSWLDQVVGRRNLNELQHPISVDYRRSARMATWGKDFTCLRDAIVPNKQGYYTDWETLQAACLKMDIPSWAQGRIVDLPVADVPSANPAFDRVVIQTNVESGSMTGQIYLHYNILEEV